MKKKILIYMIIYFILFTGCGNKVENVQTQKIENKETEVIQDVNLNIMTTDKLLYNMVKSIVKDKHTVEYMFKSRQNELNFQFTNDSLNNIAKKDLFIYMGAGYEPWMSSFIDNLNKSNVGVINASRGVKLISYNKEAKYKDTVLTDNPYYLLGIDNYKIALMNIKNSVEDKDPKNRNVYEKNFSEALKNIENYEKDLKVVKDKLSDYTFITMEDDIGYFVKNNDFKAIDLTKEQLSKDVNAKLTIEDKIKNNKNMILLCNDGAILRNYDDLIKKYRIKPIGIRLYDGEQKYEDVLKYNIEELEEFYESQAIKK